jgi:two-component system, cell cycle sensor histidine kinase and response regulator CckA
VSLLERFVQNAAFLLAVALIFDLRTRWGPASSHRRRGEVALGLLVAATAVITMIYAVQVGPGLNLDSRGVVLAISGLFFGPVSTIVAVVASSLYRGLVIGGPAWTTGVTFIVLAGLAGHIVRIARGRDRDRLAWPDFLTLGLVVGAIQIVLTGGRVGTVWPADMRGLAPILLLTNGGATVALGILLQARRRRSRISQELAEREASFRTLTEQIPVIVYRAALDETSSTLYASPGIRALGYTVEEWSRDPLLWSKSLHPDDRERVLTEFKEDRDHNRPSEMTYRMRHRDGSWRVIMDSSQIVHDARGTPLYLQGVMTDVTEQEFAASTAALQAAALDAAADAIVIMDPDGTIEWVNRAFTGLTGYTAAEAIGKNPRDLIKSGSQDTAFYGEMWTTLLAGKAWKGELVNRKKDGSLFTEEQTITPVVDAAGTITHFIAIKRDITARRDLEMQYRQAQKMEGIGRLAGGVAHDLNNLLTVINGTVELLLPKTGEAPEQLADLMEIRRAADRAAALTRQLLAFSRQQVLKVEVLDLNTVVGNMMKMLTRVIGEDVRIETHLSDDLCAIRADATQLEQVVMNLAINARDAMPTGGTLTISTAHAQLDEAFAARHVTVKPGPHVHLRVRDSGHGMDATTRARIFEPFFTTKESGKGTGLGLSTVYGIVKQSGGSIWVESSPAEGTTFDIYFPLVDEAPAIAAARSSAPRPVLATEGSEETILVVEDEDAIRQVAIRVLTRQGYKVIAANSGEAALAEVAALDRPIDLLLTDMVMPGMTGPELAKQLRAQQPGLRVLFTSGYSADAVARQFGLTDNTWAFISKPYGLADLTREVRRVLDAPVDAAGSLARERNPE